MPGNIYTLIDFRMRVLVPKSGTDMPFKLVGTVTNTNLLEPCSMDCSSPGHNPETCKAGCRWCRVQQPLCVPV